MGVLDDREEFGRRVAAVRGYTGLKKPGFAELVGKSVSTITRWEAGDVGKGNATPEGRRRFALALLEQTGAPPELFGFPAEELELNDFSEKLDDLNGQVAIHDGDLFDLRREVAALRSQVEVLIGERLEESEAEGLPDDASSSHSEGREPGEANG